jgi:hypothetical protein
VIQFYRRKISIHEIQLPTFPETSAPTIVRSAEFIQLRILCGADKIPPTSSRAGDLKAAHVGL